MNTEEFIRRYEEQSGLENFGGYPGPMIGNDEIIIFVCNGQESNGKYAELKLYDLKELENEAKKFEAIVFEYDDDKCEAAYDLLDSCELDISRLTIKRRLR